MNSPITPHATILLVLAVEPASGAAIRSRVRACSGRRFALSVGAVYEQLRALEQKGLVRHSPPAAPPPRGPGRGREGKPPRPMELTEEGRRQARQYRQFLLRMLITEAGDLDVNE